MTFNPDEKHQSQIPALQLLVALGFTPLSQEEALSLRDSRTSNVLLEGILADQLLKINSFTHRGRRYRFDLEDAHEAIRRLKPTPDQMRGLRRTNQDVYDLLVLGTTISQAIGGDSKSYTFRYVDWENPENNVYHVTAEMIVTKTGGGTTRRCDVVAFVNGIPFIVIENKRPTGSVEKAVSQLIGYQRTDNIPRLFHFSHLLLALNRAQARYATVGTPAKFWQRWERLAANDTFDWPESEQPANSKEPTARRSMPIKPGVTIIADASQSSYKTSSATLQQLVNRPLAVSEAAAVYSGSFSDARSQFETTVSAPSRAVTSQDRSIYALCRPDRLLDFVRRFTVFDGGVRKIARHQQYFAVREAVERVKHFSPQGVRKGGVIWHTQGSGKSLTMVMLGRALVLDRQITNPRIIIVTDRADLDRQIKDTFRSCEMEPVRARSGRHLLALIRNKAPLVTTIVNKFDTALHNARKADRDPNIFVLVDESHRSHTGLHGGHGQLAGKMRRLLPKACYIGFTGTPLLKSEKNTLASFGGLIHQYAIDEAVADQAVVPLLYEGRFVDQLVTGETLDSWFAKHCKGLTEEQKADLKRKYSRMRALSETRQSIRARALDISEHYRQHWKNTGFKAQLVAPSKAAAVRFKEALDDIGHVTSEIVISSSDEREGHDEVDNESKDLVRAFWARMMAKYKNEARYNRRIIDAFKGPGDPEILIVVSKLLTGFDAPRNTVLYICKPLREHTLLQAIARVNRLHEEGGVPKKFGFIVDYEGLLGELDQALTTYSAFEGYDAADVAGAVHDVRKEIGKLPQHREALHDIFKSVANKQDMEALEQFLADEAVRQEFYERLRAFSRCLHIALSSEKIHDIFDEDGIRAMKRDWKQFSELRRSVRLRYQEAVDIKDFEPKIRQLLDDHVAAMPAKTVVELVDIHDSGALKAVADETGVSDASKADRIASATRRAITENMEMDPAFYERFSKLIEATIRDYREKRLSEKDYLDEITDIAARVARTERDSDLPGALRGNNDGAAFFGIFNGALFGPDGAPADADCTAEVALDMVRIIKDHVVVDMWSNETVQNDIRNAVDDYFYDVLPGEKGIDLTEGQMDDLLREIMKLARARFRS